MMRLASVKSQRVSGAAFWRQIKTVHGSLEKLFCLLEKTMRERRFVPVARRGEFLQFYFLLVVQPRRHFDLHANMQIAVAVALQIFYALALHAKRRRGLRAGG